MMSSSLPAKRVPSVFTFVGDLPEVATMILSGSVAQGFSLPERFVKENGACFRQGSAVFLTLVLRAASSDELLGCRIIL